MGCLSDFNILGQGGNSMYFKYKKEIDALNNSKDTILNSLYGKAIFKNRTDEIENIIKENKRLAPLLQAKIKELMGKMNKSKPEIIAKGDYCNNPCYEYNTDIVNHCPKCNGSIKDNIENEVIGTKMAYHYADRVYKEVNVYSEKVCTKFTFNDKIKM